MATAIRGRSTNIVAANTDTNVVTVPTGKEMLVTRMMMANHNPATARVRFFDTFTETDGTVHSSTVNPVVLEDRALLPDESVDMIEPQGLCTAIGTIVARSTVGAADPDDVAVGAWGKFQ